MWFDFYFINSTSNIIYKENSFLQIILNFPKRSFVYFFSKLIYSFRNIFLIKINKSYKLYTNRVLIYQIYWFYKKSGFIHIKNSPEAS